MKKQFLLYAIALSVLAIAFALCASFTLAIPTPSGANGTATYMGRYTQTDSGTAVAEGGNVSLLNLSASLTTHRWQGFLGSVSSNLALGNGSSVLYNFGKARLDTVFATTNSGAYSWLTLQAGADTDVNDLWAFDGTGGADNATTAFNATSTVKGISVPAAKTTGGFITGLFNDGTNAGKDNIAFGAVVYNPAKPGLDGVNYEYQLMVPTNTASTETYYFYVSLAE